MKRFNKVYAAIMFAVLIMFSVNSVQASVCPTTNIIEDPPVFQWSGNEGTIEIGAATFNIGGETLTTRAYRQEGGEYSIPGPTMYMTPGQTYVLTFKNTLPFETPSPEHNVLKDPNITNIHTHGLHVSGESPGDDVTREINGGECGDYVYEIRPDHVGGTLWYHAHHHGSTWLQVAAGTFGMLVVDDSQDGIPTGVANMSERLLAVGYLDPAGVAGNGGDTLISGNFTSKWTVNGNVSGNLCAPVDEWQHWRVLIADPDARMKTVTVGPECEAVLMARDGVWRTTAPRALVDNTIELTGASRADLAVRCSADSTITVGNTIVANIYADPNLPADLNVGPYSNGSTGDAWSANRPSYLRDLRNETVADTQTINMGARTVNGDQYDKNVPSFNIEVPGVQEWNIKGATNHPFHLHIYHQQMQGDCGSGGAFEDGEYYDTIAGSCLVRFDSDPATDTAYDGRTIMHCHILEHEDQGAMTWADTMFGFGPPALPAGKQVLYECGGGCTPTGVSETICNGIDDDCDDLIDEDYMTTTTTCGIGECAGNTGQLECQSGTEVDTCNPLAGASPEGPFGDQTCGDGLDNDCDGATDAGDQDCQDTGSCSDITNRNECNNDPNCEWVGSRKNGACQDACTPSPEGPPGDATCSDGIDNDCDGQTDANDPDCQECIPTEPGLEITCDDGIDNDCDGLIDTADSDCPVADCSVYEVQTTCQADANCRWIKKQQVCVNR